jgi:hypothetical protein
VLSESQDVAVHHELGDHRPLSGKGVDIDCDKSEDIRVGDVLPKDSLLAEVLWPLVSVKKENGTLHVLPFGA